MDISQRTSSMDIDPRTTEMVAGTAIMLLNEFCKDQIKGSRTLVGERYIIAESGKNLDIHFRGDSMRPPSTVLTLRSKLQNDRLTSHISANFSSQDIEAFTRINAEFQRDLRFQTPHAPAQPKSNLEMG